jgi:hypothetical protein
MNINFEAHLYEQPVKCPYCHGIMEAAIEALGGHEKPKEGDLAICAFCQNVCQFDSELKLVFLDKNKLDEKMQTVVAITQEVSRQVNKKYINRN